MVNDVSDDVVDSDEIMYQINMRRFGDYTPAAAIPIPEASHDEPLTEAQFQEAVKWYVNSTGASGRFFDSLRPPEFSGERKEF